MEELKELEEYLMRTTENTITKYAMINNSEKVPVAISGGKILLQLYLF